MSLLPPSERVGHATIAHPPATIEGWFALHQVLTFDWRRWCSTPPDARAAALGDFVGRWCERSPTDGAGWSALAALVASPGDVMMLHLRPTLDALGEVRARLAAGALATFMTPVQSFLSVTEVSLYHLSAELEAEAAARGGAYGDAAWEARLHAALAREAAHAHVARRLYPARPADMPYISFYPMSKRRGEGESWYRLPLAERDRLMRAHGITGRRFAGRVVQVVTGATGFDRWEWGVTLFAHDPLDIKRVVTQMRYDEASARFAEFGEFHTGRLTSPEEWASSLIDP